MRNLSWYGRSAAVTGCGISNQYALGIASSRWKCTARSVGLPQLCGVHSRLKASASMPTRMEPEMPPTLSAISRATSSAPRRMYSAKSAMENRNSPTWSGRSRARFNSTKPSRSVVGMGSSNHAQTFQIGGGDGVFEPCVFQLVEDAAHFEGLVEVIALHRIVRQNEIVTHGFADGLDLLDVADIRGNRRSGFPLAAAGVDL